MMYLKITLTPLDAYFLGGERNFPYGEVISQLSLRNPYFIRSNRLLSQSAAFGVLRYLGIRSPRRSFDITADRQNIGPESFRLTAEGQSFGRIESISPLLLTDADEHRYIPVPRNQAGTDKQQVFVPYSTYEAVRTLDGTRYLPVDYDEKTACDAGSFLCLEDGHVIPAPFSPQVRVGINRSRQRGDSSGPGGFFKKEYVRLGAGFAFRFYATVQDDFFCHTQTTVYIGQGHTPFAARAERVPAVPPMTLPPCCRPDGRRWESATALSDLYIPEGTEALRQRCSLMLACGKSYRTFSTNHAAKTTKGRYRKGAEALKLMPAGSVFLFCGDNAAAQAEAFRAYLTALASHQQALRAGFNVLYFTTQHQNGGN